MIHHERCLGRRVAKLHRAEAVPREYERTGRRDGGQRVGWRIANQHDRRIGRECAQRVEAGWIGLAPVLAVAAAVANTKRQRNATCCGVDCADSQWLNCA